MLANIKFELVLISLFLIVNNLHSQDLKGIEYRFGLLSDTAEYNLDSLGFSQLPQFNYSNVNGIVDFDPEYSHLMDLNFDGRKDLIITNAFPPFYYVSIFLNQGNNLELVYQFPGEILDIKQWKASSEIHILKSSIACDKYSDLIQVTIDKNSKITKDYISYNYETKIIQGDLFRVEILTGIVRTTPKVNDSLIIEECTGDTLVGNRLMKLEDKSVIVLAQKGEWKLVLASKNPSYSLIGWLKDDE